MTSDRERAVARALADLVWRRDGTPERLIQHYLPRAAELVTAIDALRAYDDAHASVRVEKEGKVR